MSIVRKAGTTDISVVVRIIDSTDGTPETGVTAATAGLVLEYRRELEAEVSLATITDLAALTTAHTDKGILHIGDGYYRVDLPDAACATGQVGVLVHGVATGMVVIGEYIQLVTYDPFDGVRLGLTALPNAAADGAGGLSISDAGGLDLDAKLANTNEVTAARMGALTDWINGGRLDLILDIIAADTTTDIPALIGTPVTSLAAMLQIIDDFLDTEVAAILAAVDTEVGAIKTVTDAIGATGTGLSAIPWNAAWDAEVQSEVNDGLVAFFTSAAALVDLVWDELIAGHAGAGSTGAALSAATAPSAATVADAVWDEALSGHLTAGTSGKALSDAGGGASAATIADAVLTTALVEDYPTTGQVGSLSEIIQELRALISQFAIDGLIVTTKKRNATTTAKTYTLNSPTKPTSITELT